MQYFYCPYVLCLGLFRSFILSQGYLSLYQKTVLVFIFFGFTVNFAMLSTLHLDTFRDEKMRKKKLIIQGVSTLCANACLLNTCSAIHNKLRRLILI